MELWKVRWARQAKKGDASQLSLKQGAEGAGEMKQSDGEKGRNPTTHEFYGAEESHKRERSVGFTFEFLNTRGQAELWEF